MAVGRSVTATDRGRAASAAASASPSGSWSTGSRPITRHAPTSPAASALRKAARSRSRPRRTSDGRSTSRVWPSLPRRRLSRATARASPRSSVAVTTRLRPRARSSSPTRASTRARCSPGDGGVPSASTTALASGPSVRAATWRSSHRAIARRSVAVASQRSSALAPVSDSVPSTCTCRSGGRDRSRRRADQAAVCATGSGPAPSRSVPSVTSRSAAPIPSDGRRALPWTISWASSTADTGSASGSCSTRRPSHAARKAPTAARVVGLVIVRERT